MALIICTECGKEFSDKAAACPNCGCPVSAMNQNKDEPESIITTDSGKTTNPGRTLFRKIRKVGPIRIDQDNKLFQINGTISSNGKSSRLIGKTFKAAMAVSTAGMSVAAEKALGLGGQKVSSKEWLAFSDLLSYELIEDDAVVTSGGVGLALIGSAFLGGAGAIAGGITGKRTTRKKCDSLYIKITLNSFKVPCVMIPLITKTIKTNSKEYRNAFEDAHEILSTLDVISHNN